MQTSSSNKPGLQFVGSNGSVMFKNLIEPSQQIAIEAVVEKRSSTNMFWNRRSITLINGLFSYYSKVYPDETQTVDEIKNPRPPPKVEKSDDDEDLVRQKLEEERRLEQERLQLERSLREKEHRERLKVEAELERQRQEKEREMQERRELERRQAQEKARLQQELLDQRELENQRQQKEQLEHQKRQALKQKLGHAWNYRFIQAIEKAHLKRQSQEESVEASFMIHASITSMKRHAIEVCKQIIDELVLPVEMKRHKPTQSLVDYFSKGAEHVPEQSLNFGDDIYISDGFFIKLAFTQVRSVALKQTDQQTKPKKIQVYDETLLKSLGNEFRCMSMLADVIEEKLQQDPFFPLRVPLTALIDYKGVRAFALALPPTTNQSQVLGLQSNGTYLGNPAVFDLLCQVASELNLKVHKLTHEFTSIDIPLTLFAEVHQLARQEYTELRWIENDRNVADWAPQQLNLYVMQKCADLMPMYIDPERQLQVTLSNHKKFTQRLRPEFLASYYKQLNSDAFLATEQALDDQDVVEASLYLRKERVLTLVEKLESLDYLPIDSRSLTECFHRCGVNMRLLGLVCLQSQLPHVKQICSVEMVARVCKKVYRNNLADLLRNFSRELVGRLNGEQSNYQIVQEGISSREQILQLSQRLCLESALDFMNLVLGTGRESDIFWKQIVAKQVWYDYDFQLDITQRSLFIPKGLLLESLLTQCTFSYAYDAATLKSIFATSIPLKVVEMGFLVDCSFYQLSKSRVGSVVSHLQSYKINKNRDLILQCVRWALKLLQCQEVENSQHSFYLTELAECHLISGDLTQAEQSANEALHFEKQVSALNPLQVLIKIALAQHQQEKAIQLFQTALTTLEAQLGESHPLHCILYSILGYHYMFQRQYEDACTLYRSALVSSQRVLGLSHPQTAMICTDLGTLMTKMNQKRDALQLFEQAKNIFQAANMTDSLSYARNMLHMASLHYLLGSVQESLQPAREGVRLYEMNEFQQMSQLLEGYVLLVKILGKLYDWEQVLYFCDNIFGVLERNAMLEESTAILEFTLANIFLALLSQMTQLKREWLLEMVAEMNAINQGVEREKQVKLYQEHLNHLIQSIHQSEHGSLVRLQSMTITTILNNTERMINDSDDLMDDDLKVAVRVLESITFVIGPLVIQDLISTN